MKQVIFINSILLVLVFTFMNSCKKDDWEDHYSNYDEKIDMKLWDAVKLESRFSKFVEWIEKNELDTLFDSGLSYTLFIPNNTAIQSYNDTTGYPEGKVLSNHISQTVFLTNNINLNRKLQTLSGKFV